MTDHATPAVSLRILAWISLIAAMAAVLLLCIGNPAQLALLLSLAATALGAVCLRTGTQTAPALVGVCVGVLILFLWFVLEVVAGNLLGIDLLVPPTVTTGWGSIYPL